MVHPDIAAASPDVDARTFSLSERLSSPRPFSKEVAGHPLRPCCRHIGLASGVPPLLSPSDPLSAARPVLTVDAYPTHGVRTLSTARGLPLLPDLTAIAPRPIEEAVGQVDAAETCSEVDEFYHDVWQTSRLSWPRTMAAGVICAT